MDPSFEISASVYEGIWSIHHYYSKLFVLPYMIPRKPFITLFPSSLSKYSPGLEVRFSLLPASYQAWTAVGALTIHLALNIFSSRSRSYSYSPYHRFISSFNWMVKKNSFPLLMEPKEPRCYQLTFTRYCCLRLLLWCSYSETRLLGYHRKLGSDLGSPLLLGTF